MTYLELVNEVLELLREDAVATVDENTYSSLIARLINRAKRRVEHAYDWSRLRRTVQVTTADGTYAYVLTGAGKRWKLLRTTKNMPDVFNDTEDYYLRQATSSWMTAQLNADQQTRNWPMWFDVNGYDNNHDPIVNLYPIPNAVQNINFNVLIYQDDLSAGTDELIIPDDPVTTLAYLYAIRERGENGGTSSVEETPEFINALADAIAMDASLNPHDYFWEVE